MSKINLNRVTLIENQLTPHIPHNNLNGPNNSNIFTNFTNSTNTNSNQMNTGTDNKDNKDIKDNKETKGNENENENDKDNKTPRTKELPRLSESLKSSPKSERIVHSNGNIEEGYLLNGMKTGSWVTYWNENGQKKSVGSYADDCKTGKWIYWDISGKVVTLGQYTGGVRVGGWEETRDYNTIRWNENGTTRD
jgi:antitoxin component YwqK of YwqJK toxin-antitoxin module